MSLPKICIIAPIHIWDDVRVFKKQAVSLASQEYDVSLIARMPKALDGCKKDNVNLIRSKLSDKGKIGRMFFFYQVFIQALKCKADIYHLHNPNTIPVVFLLRALSKKVIYDTHEDYSQRLLFRDWIPNKLKKIACVIVSSLENVTANIATRAIGTQKAVVKRLGKNAILIGNQPRFNELLINKVASIKKELHFEDEHFRLVYIGSINQPRGITDIINALEIINQQASVRLWLIGDIDAQYKAELESLLGWQFVDFMGRLEQEVAFAYVTAADLGLIYIRDVGDHSQTDPNKLYEYMTFSKPFIASDFDYWRNRLQDFNAGVFVTPEMPELLAEAVCKLINEKEHLSHMGENGQLFVKSNNWEREFIKLANLYSEIV